MDSELISQSILRSIEERRRRRKGGQDPGAFVPAPSAAVSSKEVAHSCLGELEKSIRDSILTTFSQWQVNLIPTVEGMTHRMMATPPGAAARAYGPGSNPTMSDSRPVKSLSSPIPKEMPGISAAPAPSAKPELKEAPIADASWVDLTHAVRQLRQEWDGETFEARFGPSPPIGARPQAELKPVGPTEAARDVAPAAAQAAGQLPEAAHAPQPSEDFSVQALRQAPEEPAPNGRAPNGTGESAAGPVENKEDLVQKLDELIRLVRNSLDGREPAGPAVVPQKLSREIAREVAGQLRATISSCLPPRTEPAAAAPSGSPQSPAGPKQPARIPLDDVASIIDQITGMGPQ